MNRKHLILMLLMVFGIGTVFSACSKDDDDSPINNTPQQNTPTNQEQQGNDKTDPNNGNEQTDPNQNGNETEEPKITSATVSDFLKGQTAGSTVEVKLDEATPDFAKLREALAANENVNVKLDLSACTGLTEIPANAFFNPSTSKSSEVSGTGFANLVAIILPETIQKIAENAFRGCGKLVAIVIPKSVVEIAQNAFIGCESLTEIVNNSIITEIIIQEEDPGQEDPDPNNPDPNDEEIDINTDPEAPVFLPEAVLPKKIVKIENHWTEDGVHDKGDTDYDFIYDAEGRLISYRDKYDRYVFKYTKNSIIYKDGDGYDMVLTFDGNRVESEKGGRHGEVNSYYYSSDGILQKITLDDDGEALFTIQNGLITSIEEYYPEDEEGGKLTFEYTDVKNNLNLDLFYLLFGGGMDHPYLADAYGKRMPYLPSKILGTYTYEGESEADNYKFDYQFEGDYLKTVTIINYGEEENDVYSVEQYVFYFED